VIELLEPVLGAPVALEELKHKPGRRTTYRAHGARRNAIVKVYASERAPIVAARIAVLAHGPEDVEVPRVLLCSPELHLLVLSEVPGVPLREALLAADMETCARAGRALGAWHRAFQGMQPGPLARHTLDRELEILEGRIESSPPELATAVRAALRPLVDGAWGWPGALHRDLYEEQIMVGERIGLIDLDDAALGPPELDIGNVLGHIDLLELRSERRLAAATETFLAGYRRTGPELDPALLTRCRSLTLLRLVCIHREPALLELLPEPGPTHLRAAEPGSDPVAAALEQLEDRPSWLLALADGAALGAALVRRVPEFATGELELRDCRFERLRIREKSQTTVHRVTVTNSGADGDRSLELHGELVPPDRVDAQAADGGGAFATEEWRCYMPELRLVVRAEPAGSAVAAPSALTNPDEARALLENAIRACSPAYADLRIQACFPRVLGEKGARATVLYDLEFAPEDRERGWPTPVVVKTYRRDKSRKVYEAMSELWSQLGENDVVSIAEPLALVPELNAFVQGPVRGEVTLHELLVTALETGTPTALAEVADYVGKAALGLAALHTCGARANDALAWHDELAEIRELIAALSVLAPEASEAAGPLLAHLEALAAEHPPDPPVPAHGSFRSNQVLVDDGRVGFIDFDGFCRAEPARDLALFRAALKDVGLRPLAGNGRDEGARAERLARLDELCELFVARYEAAAPVSKMRVALWEALDLFTLVLYCWTKLEPGLEHRLPLLRRQLGTLPVAGAIAATR